MPKNINCITIIITLKGIEKTKTEKMITKMSEAYFFHQRWKERATNTVMASRFWLTAYIVRLFDFHFSLVYFSRLLKYILAVKFSTFACKMHHNAPQSDSNYHRIIHELLTLVSWLFWYQIFVFQVPMDMAPHSFFILFIFSLLWINPMMSLSK